MFVGLIQLAIVSHVWHDISHRDPSSLPTTFLTLYFLLLLALYFNLLNSLISWAASHVSLYQSILKFLSSFGVHLDPRADPHHFIKIVVVCGCFHVIKRVLIISIIINPHTIYAISSLLRQVSLHLIISALLRVLITCRVYYKKVLLICLIKTRLLVMCGTWQHCHLEWVLLH